MAIEETINNLTTNLPAEFFQYLDWFGVFLKTAGVLILIYIVYLIVRISSEIKRNKRIKRIEKKVDLIMDKLKIKEKK